MSKDQFIGTWKLISGEFRNSDGRISYPWGKNASGQIIYSASGYMSAQIMNPDRPRFISKDQLKGSPEEIKCAFEGYMAYFGPFEVDEKEKVVSHHVAGSVFPNLVGFNLKRHYEFSDNRLTLSAGPVLMGGEKFNGVLIWERVK